MNGDTIELFSPAKINWNLILPKKRDDGYHEIQSLVQVVNFGDHVHLTPIEGGQDTLECNDDSVPTDGSNLILKALDVFRDKTGSKQCYKVYLDKHIPMGAGLGGGSSNAATALYGANKLADAQASNADLQAWSAEVGSDLPFFFSDTGFALVSGRGEKVWSLPALESEFTNILLVKPPASLSTGEVYGQYDVRRHNSLRQEEMVKRYLKQGKFEQLMCQNDLEEPAFKLMPELEELKNYIFEKIVNVRACFMTGSGSCLVVVNCHELPVKYFPRSEYTRHFVQRVNVTSRPTPDTWYDVDLTASSSPAFTHTEWHQNSRVTYGNRCIKKEIRAKAKEIGLPLDPKMLLRLQNKDVYVENKARAQRALHQLTKAPRVGTKHSKVEA